MRPFNRFLPIAAVLAFAVASASPRLALSEESAAGAGPTFKVMGPSTCAAWPKTGAITGATKAVPLNWALGFLSGWAAQANVKLLDLVEPQDVSSWLDTYCPAHTEVSLPLAVRELERHLEAKLPAPEPPPVEAAPAPVAAAPAAPAPQAKAAKSTRAKTTRRRAAAPSRPR